MRYSLLFSLHACFLMLMVGCGGSGGGGGTATAPTPTPTPITPPDGSVTTYPTTTDDVFETYVPPADAQYAEQRDADGRLIAQGFISQTEHGEEIPVGPFIAYYANGNKALEGQFDQRGVRTGWWHEWYEHGQQHHEGCYIDGALDSTKFWFRRDPEGTLLSGKLTND